MQDAASSSNVILFSRYKSTDRVIDLEQIKEDTDNFKEEIANDVAEMAMENVIGMLTSYGALRDSTRISTFDMMLLENAIQGLLYRYYQIPHPIHEIADEAFQIDDVEEEVEEK